MRKLAARLGLVLAGTFLLWFAALDPLAYVLTALGFGALASAFAL